MGSKTYKLGRHTVDHSACTSLLARWAMIVQEFKHRSGKSNANADVLSHNNPSSPPDVESAVLAVQALDSAIELRRAEVIEEQEKDRSPLLY